jgi:hypothetical protein
MEKREDIQWTNGNINHVDGILIMLKVAVYSDTAICFLQGSFGVRSEKIPLIAR